MSDHNPKTSSAWNKFEGRELGSINSSEMTTEERIKFSQETNAIRDDYLGREDLFKLIEKEPIQKEAETKNESKPSIGQTGFADLSKLRSSELTQEQLVEFSMKVSAEKANFLAEDKSKPPTITPITKDALEMTDAEFEKAKEQFKRNAH